MNYKQNRNMWKTEEKQMENNYEKRITKFQHLLNQVVCFPSCLFIVSSILAAYSSSTHLSHVLHLFPT